jgi:ketosteroid isomerase-like protein
MRDTASTLLPADPARTKSLPFGHCGIKLRVLCNHPLDLELVRRSPAAFGGMAEPPEWIECVFQQGVKTQNRTRSVAMKLMPLSVLLLAALLHAEAGPCRESAVKQGNAPLADDAFAYMPPYGKPVTGQPAIRDANSKSFSDRTNIKKDWVGEHKVVSAPSGDMAYEYGTVHMSYDSKGEGGHQEFEAVILAVYQARGGACQKVALTMQPLDEKTGH